MVSDRNGNNDIYIAAAEGGNQQQLIESPFADITS
jgi:Tol biopolymer transport system component